MRRIRTADDRRALPMAQVTPLTRSNKQFSRVGLALVCLLFGACGAEDAGLEPTPVASPDEQADSPTPGLEPTPDAVPFRVLGSTPSMGAMAVPRGTSFTFFFSAPLTTDPALLRASILPHGSASIALEPDAMELSSRTLRS